MVREIEQIQSSTDESSSNPIYFRCYSLSPKQRQKSGLEFVHGESLSSIVGAKTHKLLDQKIRLLLKNAKKLLEVDCGTGEVTRPLEHYTEGITFTHLREGNYQIDGSRRVLIFDLETISQIAASQITQEWLHIALAIFLLHEVTHISQRLGNYENVQLMKKVTKYKGRERVGELDLKNDFLAVHTLSLLLTLHSKKTYNRRIYIEWFYEIWYKVCRPMLDIFPPSGREDKQQRVFGHLLMSNLIRDAHISNYPLEFDGELWPVWNESLDWLSIYSDGEPLISGNPVDPNGMNLCLSHIRSGEYDVAAEEISKIWRQLPRR